MLAALLLLPAPRPQACTNVLVTKGASKTGSTMISYSADSHQLYGELYYKPAAKYAPGTMMDVREWDSGRYLGQIAQVARTYSTVGNMNEYQLAIGETTYGGREGLVDTTGLMDYGSLIYIALQRAKTAREAIAVMTGLVEQYGYYSSGESFSIADPSEVWILELIGKGTKMLNGQNANKGAVWVAVRIPDGYISAHANQARITTFPLNDPQNCLYSKDVISFAREMGFYKGADKDFSFSDTYAPLTFSAMRGCEARVWSVFNKVTPGMDKYIDYAMGHNPGNRMPLWVKPQEKLSVGDVMNFMRDHYEDTPMDMRNDIGAGGHNNPYRWRPMQWEVDGKEYVNERAIATQQTGFWFVTESRGWLPDMIGGLNWFGVDDAGTSCLTPIYSSANRVPLCFKEGNGDMLTYSPTSAFWLFNRVTNFAYMRYGMISADILKVVKGFTDECLTEIPAVDAAAKILYDKDPELARNFLTNYSVQRADRLFETWDALDKYLLVKYMDGNVKLEGPEGFLYNDLGGKT
ncbi:MAG: C69 family dipeptidase, partial [Rikenellaceae bacterium]|nr:C69 family dipeptidase [Rikenellaceae bacterium]